MCKLYSDTFISRPNDVGKATEPSHSTEILAEIELTLGQLNLIEYGPQLDPGIFDQLCVEITAWNLFRKYVADNLQSNIPRNVIWIQPHFSGSGEHRLQVSKSNREDGVWRKEKENYAIVDDDGTGRILDLRCYIKQHLQLDENELELGNIEQSAVMYLKETYID